MPIEKIIWIISSGFLIVSGVASVFADRVTAKASGFTDFLKGYFKREGVEQRLLLLLGIIGYGCCALLNLSQDNESFPLIGYEVGIILFIVSITSALFQNFDNNNPTGKNALNNIGKLHLILLGTGLIGILPMIKPMGDNEEHIVDFIAHSITFFSSYFGIMGQTTDNNGNLNSHGRALSIIIIVFSSVSILTSANSTIKQRESANAINAQLDNTKFKLDTVEISLSKIDSASDEINRSQREAKQLFVKSTDSIAKKYTNPIDLFLKKELSKQGFISGKIGEVGNKIGMNDSTLLGKVGIIRTDNEERLKKNEMFIGKEEAAFTALGNEFQNRLNALTLSSNALDKQTEQSRLQFQDLIKANQKLTNQLNEVEKLLNMKRELSALLNGSNSDSLLIVKIKEILQKN